MKRFPHCQQLNLMDCGPACLKMVAEHYGRHYSLETLRNRSFITREGVSMLGISDAAESIGLRSTGIRTTLDKLTKANSTPCIMHWRQNHFVVLYGIHKRLGKLKYLIADPASQKLAYSRDEVEKCWANSESNGEKCGTLLLLQPSPEFYESQGEFHDTTWRGLAHFARYLLPYKKQFLQVGIALLMGSMLQLIFPFLTQALVDVGIGQRHIGFITMILMAQLFLFGSQLLVGFMRSWIMLHVNARIDIALISDFLIKLMKLPLRFFDTKMTGDLMQRIGDHDRIKSLLMNNTLTIIFSSVTFIVFAVILGYYFMPILLIFLAGNILYILWIWAFMKYRRELDIKRFNLSANEQSSVIQLIQGMQEIKLNNCEKRKRWEWERIQVKLFKVGLRGLAIGQIQQIGSSFFTQSTNILITFIAAKAVVDGQMTLGMMMSITYIIGQLTAPISDFISLSTAIQDAKISLERLNEIHKRPDEEQNIETKITELPDDKSIYLKDITFSYSGAERDYALNGVSLDIPQHKVTAIVGASGSGKTTIVKLLQGFYEPMHGSIKIGSTPLLMINPHLWRSLTGSVMQEGFIFSDTIARNIAVGSDEIDREKLAHAAKVANIEDFILSLPMGYSTKIGMEGNGISSGQKQRILIARAVYKNPEYIFFDEATNSLDANNESIIMSNLKEFYRGKTAVIVAHRLSTVVDADKIIVMDHGKVVEEGTHRELLAIKGKYFTLVKNQIELGLS